MGLHSNDRLIAFPENIRLLCKLVVANTLAYYEKATIMSIKSIMVLAPGLQKYS
jgi:hypothetical protein